VKPYLKRGKSDAIDAEASCEAVTRPTMRFVAVKTVEQQALLSLHRAQDLRVRQRNRAAAALRSACAEHCSRPAASHQSRNLAPKPLDVNGRPYPFIKTAISPIGVASITTRNSGAIGISIRTGLLRLLFC
jgi:hypothetical protein